MIDKGVIKAVTPVDTDNHFITFENDIEINFALPISNDVKVKLMRNYIMLHPQATYGEPHPVYKYMWKEVYDEFGDK